MLGCDAGKNLIPGRGLRLPLPAGHQVPASHLYAQGPLPGCLAGWRSPVLALGISGPLPTPDTGPLSSLGTREMSHASCFLLWGGHATGEADTCAPDDLTPHRPSRVSRTQAAGLQRLKGSLSAPLLEKPAGLCEPRSHWNSKESSVGAALVGLRSDRARHPRRSGFGSRSARVHSAPV